MEMQYKGESVYPNTISNGFSVQLNIVGYEGAEKITFQSLDSTIVLPGFDSEKIMGKFNYKKERIIIELSDQKDYSETEFNLTKEIQLGHFELIRYPNKNILGLRSKSTGIKIVNEKYLLKNRIDNLMF